MEKLHDVSRYYGVLAHHSASANMKEKAMHYYEKAAVQVSITFDNSPVDEWHLSGKGTECISWNGIYLVVQFDINI